VDPNEECDVGDLLEDKGCSQHCRIMPRAPPPPAIVPDTPPSWNNTNDNYCSPNSDGVVCQNCADTCPTGDRGGTDGDNCMLPRVLGGALLASDMCTRTGLNNECGRIFRRNLNVRYTASHGSVSFTKVGTVHIMLRRSARVTVSIRMTCPWLLWSTPSVSSGRRIPAMLAVLREEQARNNLPATDPDASCRTQQTVPTIPISKSG
jgi:hypothetical protein